MGITVTATTDNELKPIYAVATVLAAAFTLADADMSIWIGNATPFNKLEEISALKSCLEYIRENGNVTPTGANESYAELGTSFKKDVNGAFNAAAALPEEAKVGIWYGPDFQPIAGATITPYVIQAIERYIESTQKAA